MNEAGLTAFQLAEIMPAVEVFVLFLTIGLGAISIKALCGSSAAVMNTGVTTQVRSAVPRSNRVSLCRIAGAASLWVVCIKTSFLLFRGRVICPKR